MIGLLRDIKNDKEAEKNPSKVAMIKDLEAQVDELRKDTNVRKRALKVKN